MTHDSSFAAVGSGSGEDLLSDSAEWCLRKVLTDCIALKTEVWCVNMGRRWQYDYRPTHCWSKKEIEPNFPGEKELDATQTSMGLPARFLRTTSFLCSAMPNAARAGVPCCVGDACDVCGVWDGAFSLHHRGPLRYALLLRQTANRPALLPKVAEHPMKLRQIS